jgi:hypothetical protein
VRKIEGAMDIANRLVNDIIFMCETRTKQTYFTRRGKMDFKNTLMFMLNFVKKSMKIELDFFFKRIAGDKYTITKQGYAEARKKISPSAFIKLSNVTTSWYYEDDDFKKYKGYRLSAIDSTVIGINNTKRLREAYDCVWTNGRGVARATAACIYDIENDMVLTSKITRYNPNERNLAVDLIEQLKCIGMKKELIIFDRGYPSLDLIEYLEKNSIKYLMRIPSNKFKAANEALEGDQIVDFKIRKDIVRIRVLKFDLESGEKEVLITNLFDSELDTNDFKELYFKRWGIEVKYNEIKNKLQLENFTGDTQIVIEQDFYASIYLANLVSIAKAEANQKIEEKNKGKELKYSYKVNTNILIGKLKDNLVLMLLEDNPRKRSKMLSRIIEEISHNCIPIRPGRKYPRNMSVRSNKYSLSQKKVL